MEPIHKRVAGMDVHRMEHVVTVLVEQEDGTLLKDTRKFGGFKRDMRALIDWLRSHRIQQVVIIYWKSVFSHLEAASSREGHRLHEARPRLNWPTDWRSGDQPN